MDIKKIFAHKILKSLTDADKKTLFEKFQEKYENHPDKEELIKEMEEVLWGKDDKRSS